MAQEQRPILQKDFELKSKIFNEITKTNFTKRF